MPRHAFDPTSHGLLTGLRVFVLLAAVILIPLAAVTSWTVDRGDQVDKGSIADVTFPPRARDRASRFARAAPGNTAAGAREPAVPASNRSARNSWARNSSADSSPTATRPVRLPPPRRAAPLAERHGEQEAGRQRAVPPGPGEPHDERLHRLQHRLRALGVNYMRLGLQAGERAGAVYHFHCRLPIPDNPLYSRPFDARASEPLVAMQQALHDVEAWRASRQSLVER